MKRSRILLVELVEFIGQEVARELARQGHKASGRLARSITARGHGDRLSADLLWEHYGEIINKGVSRDRIPYTPGSGAKRSRYITALIRYVKQRRLKPRSGQNAKSIAFAIANSQKQRGMPTPASRRFSQTGRRTGALQEAIQGSHRQQLERVEQIGLQIIEETINEVLDAVAASPYIYIT